jgi:hypothetical protein
MMRASRCRSGSAALLLLLAALCGAVHVSSSADETASGTDPSLLLASEDSSSSSLFYGLSLDNVVEPPPSPPPPPTPSPPAPPLPSPPPYDVHMHEIVEDVRVEVGDSFYGQGLASFTEKEKDASAFISRHQAFLSPWPPSALSLTLVHSSAQPRKRCCP